MTGEPFGAAYRDKQKTLKLLYLQFCTHLKWVGPVLDHPQGHFEGACWLIEGARCSKKSPSNAALTHLVALIDQTEAGLFSFFFFSVNTIGESSRSQESFIHINRHDAPTCQRMSRSDHMAAPSLRSHNRAQALSQGEGHRLLTMAPSSPWPT